MFPVVFSSVTVSAIVDTVTPAAVGTAGVPISSSEGRPSLAPVRVAVTRTVYSVPLVRLGIVWLVVVPEVAVNCRVVLL